jgi:hypothetical protein
MKFLKSNWTSLNPQNEIGLGERYSGARRKGKPVMINTTIIKQNYPDYNCPVCGTHRLILREMYHAKGGTRQANRGRKEAAKLIIDKCPLCREYIKGGS